MSEENSSEDKSQDQQQNEDKSKGPEPADSDINKQFKELWSGTTRIGASFGQVFANMGDIFSGREHVLMVRVNDATLEKVDQLVEAGMFKSRSESAAYLLAKGINADSEIFEVISTKVGEINKLREELHEIIGNKTDK